MKYKGYQYYSIMRPVSIGTCPTKGLEMFTNYDERTFIGRIGREAWAELIYSRELTDEECRNYELVRGL